MVLMDIVNFTTTMLLGAKCQVGKLKISVKIKDGIYLSLTQKLKTSGLKITSKTGMREMYMYVVPVVLLDDMFLMLIQL